MKKINFIGMSSIRRLKKDIDCLTFAVIDDCINCLSYGKNTDEISEIVQRVICDRNKLRQRIYAVKKEKKAAGKAGYKAICSDLLVSVDGAFSQLSGLVKKA